MATIAADAGVGIGTLYRRYPSREALLDALTGCLGLQSHQVTGGCFIQASAVVDYQHVARCCRFGCLQESIDAAGMPGVTDTTG